VVEQIRFGNVASFNSNLTTATVVERIPSNGDAEITSNGGGQPQLHYTPFQSRFDTEPSGLTSTLRMTQEIVGIEI